jgi:hypothetical protein
VIIVPSCRQCGAGVDEDGYADCDCGRPHTYCPCCGESVLEDCMQESVGFDFKTQEFCEDCEENFYEQQDMWWYQVAEDSDDLLYEIHQTIEMIQQKAKVYKH